MTLDQKAREAASAWFDAHFNGLPDTNALTEGVITAYLDALASRPSAIVEEPVAVAWVVLLNYGGGRWSGNMLTDVLPSDATTYKIVQPLYAHPHTGRAGVTEEMVEAALAAYGAADLGGEAAYLHEQNLRAALNAALTVENDLAATRGKEVR